MKEDWIIELSQNNGFRDFDNKNKEITHYQLYFDRYWNYHTYRHMFVVRSKVGNSRILWWEKDYYSLKIMIR